MSTALSGGQRSLGWLVLPALAVFTAFGLVPLVGVLALSFTSWDGLGEGGQPAATAVDSPSGTLA